MGPRPAPSGSGVVPCTEASLSAAGLPAVAEARVNRPPQIEPVRFIVQVCVLGCRALRDSKQVCTESWALGLGGIGSKYGYPWPALRSHCPRNSGSLGLGIGHSP
eukprot:4101047-Alexandrium_andersonii.AAC.1